MPPKNVLPSLSGLSLRAVSAPTGAPPEAEDEDVAMDPAPPVYQAVDMETDPPAAAGVAEGAEGQQGFVVPARYAMSDAAIVDPDRLLPTTEANKLILNQQVNDALEESAAAQRQMSPEAQEALERVRRVEIDVGQVPSKPMDFARDGEKNRKFARFWEIEVRGANVPERSKQHVADAARVLTSYLKEAEVLLLNTGSRQYDGDPSTRSTSVADVGGQSMSCLHRISGVSMASDSFGAANEQMREALSLVGRNTANKSAEAALQQAKSIAMAMVIPKNVTGYEGAQWLIKVNKQLIENATEQIKALTGTVEKDGQGYKLSGGALVYGDPNKGFVQQKEDELQASYERVRRQAVHYKEMEMAVHHAKQNWILDHVMAAEMWAAWLVIKKQVSANPSDLALAACEFVPVATQTKDWAILKQCSEALTFYQEMHQNYNQVNEKHRKLQELVNTTPEFVLKDLPPLVVPEFVQSFEERHDDWLVKVDELTAESVPHPPYRQWKKEALTMAERELDRLKRRVAEKKENIEYLKNLAEQLRKLWDDALTDYKQLELSAEKDIRNNALARWGSMEQFRRSVLEEWVRRSAYIREADTLESVLGRDETTGYQPYNLGWVNKQWVGRRMRDKRDEGADAVPEVAGAPGRGRFAEDGHPLRTPRLTCAYESLLWYFGGDESLELMSNVDQYRQRAIRAIGCNLANDDPIVRQRLMSQIPGLSADARLDPAGFDNFPEPLQELVASAGMRYYCARLDTLALCTIDKIAVMHSEQGESLVKYDVYQAQAIRENPTGRDPNANRSEEWKTATSILDLLAKLYCVRACIAGGHDQLFVSADEKTQLYQFSKPVLKHEPALTNVPFAMPGVAFELKLTRAQAQTTEDPIQRGKVHAVTGQSPKVDEEDKRFMEPFRWEDTILLSKMFSLVEQMALDVEPDPSTRQKWDGPQLRLSKIETYHQVFKDTATQQARNPWYTNGKSWTNPKAWGSKRANMITPSEWQTKTLPKDGYIFSSNYQAEQVSEEDCDYETLNHGKLDRETVDFESERPTSVEDVDARGWSLGMEIEANPHAAALWAVYLHRLLTLRVLVRPKDDEEAVDPNTGEKVKLNLDAYFTYGLMSQLFDTEGMKAEDGDDLASKRRKKRAENPEIPNTCDAWIYIHPSVQMFRLSPLGIYMHKVFETAKHSWGVRESRVLELALVWGGRKLNSGSKATDKLEAELLNALNKPSNPPEPGTVQSNEAHLKFLASHSALQKVELVPNFTAADLYVDHYKFKPVGGLTKTMNWCRSSLYWVNPHTIAFFAQALAAANFVLPGYGLVQHGLNAYLSLNPTARQILHTAFGSMLFRHVAPETSKATIVAGSKVLMNAGIMAGNLLENARQTATSVASIVPLTLAEALRHGEILKPTDIFLTTLDDIAAGMLDGKGIYEMFSAWKQTMVDQINETYNSENVANFNHKSVMSMQGFMWGMLKFGWVDPSRKPVKLKVVGAEQWKMRFSAVQYLVHIDHMQARPDEHGPVIWEVFEEDGVTAKFSWIDEPTFRCALLTTQPSIARVIGVIQAFTGAGGLAVSLASDGLKNGIDAALDLTDYAVKEYSESDPLTFDLIRTSVETRVGAVIKPISEAADTAFQQTSAYLRMMYECSDVGMDIKKSVASTTSWTNYAYDTWSYWSGGGEHPRERAECKEFFNDRQAWWKRVMADPTRKQPMDTTKTTPGATPDATPDVSMGDAKAPAPKRAAAGDYHRKPASVDPTVNGGVCDATPGIPLSFPDIMSARGPSEPQGPSGPVCLLNEAPRAGDGVENAYANWKIIADQSERSGMAFVGMLAIVGMGGGSWISLKGSALMKSMLNMWSAPLRDTEVVPQLISGVQAGGVDDLMQKTTSLTRSAMTATPSVGGLAQKLKLKTTLSKLARFPRFNHAFAGTSQAAGN